MKHTVMWLSRASSPAGKAGLLFAALCLGSMAGIAPAAAHVHVDADSPTRGGTTNIAFQVPNESETGSPTTEFTVLLPSVASARTQLLPGWTAVLDRDTAAGTVRSVTWKAAQGGGIPADQFEMFGLRLTLPDADTVVFPATQTYADGTVVRWDQTSAPGAPEPERPAPALALDAGPAGHSDHHAPVAAPPAAPTDATPEAAAPAPLESAVHSDNVARALAGGALLLAAVGVVLALVRRRA